MGISEMNTLEGVLELALKKEQAAFKFYENLLAKHSQHRYMADLLELLKTEEAKHVRLIEKKLAKLRLG